MDILGDAVEMFVFLEELLEGLAVARMQFLYLSSDEIE